MTIIGNALLVLAAVAALSGVTAFLLGIYLGTLLGAHPVRESLSRLARRATFLTACFMTLAVAVLLIALLSHDFSLRYVYFVSARSTPFVYLISALWASNAGSLLFWGWLVAVVGALVLWRGKVSKELLAYTVPIILFTEIFFLILIFLPDANQNPFNSLTPVPPDGLGMNPILQHPGMVFHPPALLIGWALILVPFAMAMGALITRRLDGEWLVSARRWALAAWVFLGAGNLLGAWWAYYELSFGGYWAWDPVENAGLIPWLLITAFLHAIMLWQRRSLNKIWGMAFIVLAFLTTIFGAFLTRSSILNSVHTFGATPAEPVFVVFMALILVGSLALIITRWRDLKDGPGDNAFISGETTFFANNLLLALATASVFIGTMLPFFSRIFGNAHIDESGSDFFNSTAVPLFLVAILLSGFCVLVGFRKPKLAEFGRALIFPTAGAVLVVLASFILGIKQWHVLATSFILAFALFATITKWVRDVSQRRAGKQENYFRTFCRLFSANRPRYGGYIVHIAIVIIAVGITGSSVYDVRLNDVRLSPGESVLIADTRYILVYDDYTTSATETTMNLTARFDLYRGEKFVGTLNPAINYDATWGASFKAAVRSTLADDVYLSLWGAEPSTRDIGVSITVVPLVSWIWIGSVILFLGGLWAFSTPKKKLVGNEDQ